MFRRIIWNDLRKSPTISAIMLLFITAAAVLISLAVTLGLQLAGSIDSLMVQAKTPHFLQMHTGEINIPRLEHFAQENGAVREFQVMEFLNIDGAEIKIGDSTLEDSVQDNGLTTQSRSFDYLLDLDGEIIRPEDGEIYVPLAYAKKGNELLGKNVIVAGKTFTVAGFLRDSQMNSPLASSKRFLVSDHDYGAMKNKGTVEYMIEFRLKSLSELNAFEAEYIGAGLESNGPTVTYPLFRMINAVSDGLMIAVLLLISILAVLIAFLCIRFTLIARIEEDAREIGIMKAIGLRISDMKKLYLGKYAVIAGAGSGIGWGVSAVLEDRVIGNIRLTMGESATAASARMWGAAAVFFVFAAVIAYVNHVLNRFQKIPAAQAIRFGTVVEKGTGVRRMRLRSNRLVNTNVFLGIKDVISRKRLYITMLSVVIVSTFIMLIPQNLYSTISSPGFTSYMGIGRSDILFRVQQTDQMSEKITAIMKTLETDEAVTKYVVHTTKRFAIQTKNGKSETIKVDLGDHTEFPVYYVKGEAPQTEDEIALSVMNARELEKKIGDTLVLTNEGRERILNVCGIYSDITNGGKTAKAAFGEKSGDAMWYTVYVKLKDNGLSTAKATEYTKQFSFAKVADLDGYIAQTFGPTIDSIKKISVAAMIAALLMTILVTLLMMKMLIAKERHTIAIMKSLGFTNRDITIQFISRFALVLFIGILAGTILANTLGEVLAGAVIASFGAATFKFVVNPVSAYLISPLAMGCAVVLAVALGTTGIENIQVSSHIKE